MASPISGLLCSQWQCHRCSAAERGRRGEEIGPTWLVTHTVHVRSDVCERLLRLSCSEPTAAH